MRVAMSVLGKGFWALVIAATGAGGALSARPASAADVDAYLIKGTAALIEHTPEAWSYALSNVACVDASPVPTYVDLPADNRGVCASATGGGTIDGACGSGLITAGWTFAEPGESDSAVMYGEGVMVNNLAVIVANPTAVSGDGYFDPPSSTSPGTAVTLAAFAPASVPSPCGGGGLTLAAAVVAAY
jgi:hypothetical protein